MVPSGHEEKTHGPAEALRVREGSERKNERTRDRREGRWRPASGRQEGGDEGLRWKKVADVEAPEVPGKRRRRTPR